LTSYHGAVHDLVTRRSSNLGRLLIRAYLSINRTLVADLGALGHRGLRLGHVSVLSNLDLATPTRMVVIAERAGVTKQAVSPIVRQLEDLGYVTTAPDPGDGRVRLVKFTARGRRLILDAQPVIESVEHQVRSVVGDDGFGKLVSLLTAILAADEASEAYPNG
jgi:DNA-binding MarR family transcriptional regulator